MKKLFITILLAGVARWALGQSFPTPSIDNIALFPQQNDLRNTLCLSGIWHFKKDTAGVGEKEGWQNGLTDAREIAVPGSWNEQFTDSRDYLGLAWYEMETYVPASWQGQRIFLRIGSANYAAKVWINGQPVAGHLGGHLPFAFEIGENVQWGMPNRISVQVENELSPARVPTGNVPGGFFSNFPKSNYDFFPYAGLQRDVWLYSIPTTAAIQDITVKTDFYGNTGSLQLNLITTGNATKATVVVAGNGSQQEVAVDIRDHRAETVLSLADVRLWTPDDPFLYTVDVRIGNGRVIWDHYTLETGVRTIAVTEKQLLLNGQPIFLKGFGKHEDFPIFGKGTARPVMVKDYALMKWMGANSYRTSHYPYDEEYMRLADREGILVIDEIPAVGLYFHGDTSELAQRQMMCKQYIDELITRDKNHPSVILWSVANEPMPANLNLAGAGRDATPESIQLFQELIDQVHASDPTRLATLAGVMGGPAEWLGLCDVISINRYYGWYTHQGDMKTALGLLNMELDGLHNRFHKPILITEFGADTYAGMHADEPEMFTEEFQTEFIKAYLDVADSKDYMAGMHIWAFADFKTGQGIIRFGGMNYKGVFTRDRKPKAAALYLRSRWKQ